MNKKAQTSIGKVGMIIIAFVGVIIGITLMISSAGIVGTSTTAVTLTNSTITSPANGSAIDLTGQDLLSTPVVHNATDGAVVPTSNYTLTERVSPTTGVKTVYFQNDDSDWNSASVNVSYVYGPDGYINNGASRSIAGLIVIFFALAIAMIGLTLVKGDKLFELIGR